jgi:hypothetical protein
LYVFIAVYWYFTHDVHHMCVNLILMHIWDAFGFLRKIRCDNKSCIIFILIVFGFTCSFVDPLQSTVLTTLTTSSKWQNNIDIHRSHVVFQYFSYVTMVTIKSWRTSSSFASCATRGTRLAMLPHMCGNKFSQVKTTTLAPQCHALLV